MLLDPAGSTVLARLATGWADRLTIAVAAEPAPTALVRPDGYVAWATDGVPDLDQLRTALVTWLGAAD